MTNEKIDALLKKVDIDKRATLKRLICATFVAPAIASFPIDGLKIDSAFAQLSNGGVPIPSPLAGASNASVPNHEHELDHDEDHEHHHDEDEDPHRGRRLPR